MRALDAHAQSGHEHEQQQHHAPQQQQVIARLDALQLGARHPPRQACTRHQEQAMADQIVERVAVLVDRRRRHHHHAQRRQRQHGAEQPGVEAAPDGFKTCGLARRVVHQRTFNVARPTRTSTTEMIQKRTITRGSGQPFSSK
ncbi:hypothetical protein D9M69_652350 [compost metagenome]